MGWLIAISNTLVAFGFFSIPITGFYYWKQRRNDVITPTLLFSLNAFLLFCASNRLCDLFHERTNPLYVVTIVVSAFFAICTIVCLPRGMLTILYLPSREMLHSACNAANRNLLLVIEQRKVLERQVIKLESANRHLQRVIETSMWVHDTQKALEELQVAVREIQDGVDIANASLRPNSGEHDS
jgi:hypothetical protein